MSVAVVQVQVQVQVVQVRYCSSALVQMQCPLGNLGRSSAPVQFQGDQSESGHHTPASLTVTN